LRLTSVIGAVIVFVLTFTSCNRPGDDATNTREQERMSFERIMSEREERAAIYTGYYIEYGEGKYFKRSPSGRYYQVIDETGELSKRYNEMEPVLGGFVYVSLRGQPNRYNRSILETYGSRSERCSLHSRQSDQEELHPFLVIEILEMDYVRRDNPIFPFAFRCYGEEPFWSLDIIRDQEAIFRDIGEGKAYYLPYESPEIIDDTYSYTFKHWDENSEVETMHVTISKQQCFDSMSGEEYEFAATIEFRSNTLPGCAERLLQEKIFN
jgi:uncharacterized membrane protein